MRNVSLQSGHSAEEAREGARDNEEDMFNAIVASLIDYTSN